MPPEAQRRRSKPTACDRARDAPEDGPMWARIARSLATEIERGTHAPGSLLPSAALIADAHRVNRHTARQALRHLQDLGLVSVERGRGTIVQEQRFPYRLGRRVSFRANFGAAGVEVAGEVLESQIAKPTREIAALLRLPVGDTVWEIRTISRAAGMPVSTSVHRLSVSQFPDFERRLVAARASITAAFRGYGITDYVRLSTRLTSRIADRDEVRLLKLARGSAVMQSRAVDGLPDGTALQVVVGTFAGDRVEMVIDAGA